MTSIGEILAVRLDRLRESVERGDVELLHELAADIGALDQELLVVAVELVELAGLAILVDRSRILDGLVRRGR